MTGLGRPAVRRRARPGARTAVPACALLTAAAMMAALLVTGCASHAAERRVGLPRPSTSPTGTPSASALPARPSPPVPAPTASGRPLPSGFGEAVAVPCAGRPSAAQVLALLRTQGLAATGASVQLGPLCAGTWQYSVVTQSGHEPLQVVTRGAPDALRLVTAGTYVCSADVRAEAPPGILELTRCA